MFYQIPNDYVGAEGEGGGGLSDKLIFLLSAISQHICQKLIRFIIKILYKQHQLPNCNKKIILYNTHNTHLPCFVFNPWWVSVFPLNNFKSSNKDKFSLILCTLQSGVSG